MKDAVKEGEALAMLAKCAADPREAVRMLEAALQPLQRVQGQEARLHEAEVLHSIAIMREQYLRDARGAQEAFVAAVNLFSQAGQRVRAAKALRLLAGLSAQIGDVAKAAAHLEDAAG